MAIQDINPTVPVGSDPVSGGDEEFRLLKTDILQSLPGMTGPWTAPAEDAQFQDIDIRSASISDQILENPQVAIAVFGFNGTTGAVVGSGFGVVGGIRVSEGVYEFTLTDNITNFNQTVVCGGAFVGLLALNMFGNRDGTELNVIQVVTNSINNGSATDASNGFVAVFDAERT